MAKVSLRGYITEIDHLIDNNQLDEAIAHCIHILSSYPKHGDTYRLLGKAFLERQRYRDAADMFMHVLAIFPDDFVAHIGISIVREEQSDLDHAIFHMERAFEVQPSNTAIQDELKRLYGKRDGVIPTKIRLTHPALARLYSKGDLNQQAVGELRVALNESPVRSDILAQLAELYTKENQTTDAIETCNKLLERLPYCFGALTVLTRLLPGTPFAQDVPMYKSRLDELDPYNAFKSSITQPLSEVSDDAVSIEPLIWSPDTQMTVNMVDWASSMGINLVEPQEYDPSMILTKPSDSVNPRVSDIPTEPKIRQPKSSSSPVGTPANELPKWMEAAGWSKSDQSADNYPEPSESEQHISKEPSKKTDKLRSPADTTSLEDSPTPEIYSKLHTTDAVLDTFESDLSPATPTVPDDSDTQEPATSLSPGAIPKWLRSIAPPEYLDNKPQPDQPVLSVSKNTNDEAFSSIFPTNETTKLETEPPASTMAESDANFDSVAKDRLSTDVSPGDEEQILSRTDKFSSSAAIESQIDIEGALKNTEVADSTVENIKRDIPEPVIPSDDTSHDIDPFANLRMSFQPEESHTGSSETGPLQSGAAQLPVESDEQADNSVIPPAEEIPDWLRTLAATTEKTEPSPDETTRDKLPAWLQDFEQKIDEQPAAPSPFTMPPIKEAPTTELQSDRLTPDIVGPSEVPMQEEINPIEEASKEKQPHDMTSPPPQAPFSTEDSNKVTTPETTNEDEERPAWLSKLIGIDDIELPTSAPSREKPEEAGSYSGVPENLDDIPGATQAAWIMDVVASKDSEGQVSEEKVLEEQVSEAPPVPEPTIEETAPKPQPVVVPEEIITSEPGDGETVPDLSLIVEGLQAAWMSEHVEDTDIFKSITPDDTDSSKQGSISDETIVIEPVEDQQSKDAKAQPEKAEPIIEKNIETEAAAPLPVTKQKQPRVTRHTPVPEVIPPDDILKDARKAFSHGVVDESLDRYVELINRNRLIDNVIEDLDAMSSAQPDDSYIWQTLGDAYTRRNKLDLALSAYHKAEDLLK